ncbi:MAG: phosphotransferase [Myxococcota bacterium]
MNPFEPTDVPEPLRRWLPAGTTLAYPDQGMTSSVAFAGPVVLKRCTDPLYLSWLRREREVLGALRGTGLPVPEVLDFLDFGAEAWLVMTRRPGIQCAEAMLHGSRAEQLELMRIVGAAARRLHDTPAPAFFEGRGPWLDRQLHAARENLPWCDGSPELLEHLLATRPAPVPSTLIHGDLNLENVLVADGAVTGFIDWAGGDIGDPRCDITLALVSDEKVIIDAELTEAFYTAYGSGPSPSVRTWYEGLYEFF